MFKSNISFGDCNNFSRLIHILRANETLKIIIIIIRQKIIMRQKLLVNK